MDSNQSAQNQSAQKFVNNAFKGFELSRDFILKLGNELTPLGYEYIEFRVKCIGDSHPETLRLYDNDGNIDDEDSYLVDFGKVDGDLIKNKNDEESKIKSKSTGKSKSKSKSNGKQSVKKEKGPEILKYAPFVKESVDEKRCKGVVYNGGLYTQCKSSKLLESNCLYCKKCQKSADKNDGIPEFGNTDSRSECLTSKYKHFKKGKEPWSLKNILYYYGYDIDNAKATFSENGVDIPQEIWDDDGDEKQTEKAIKRFNKLNGIVNDKPLNKKKKNNKDKSKKDKSKKDKSKKDKPKKDKNDGEVKRSRGRPKKEIVDKKEPSPRQLSMSMSYDEDESDCEISEDTIVNINNKDVITSLPFKTTIIDDIEYKIDNDGKIYKEGENGIIGHIDSKNIHHFNREYKQKIGKLPTTPREENYDSDNYSEDEVSNMI